MKNALLMIMLFAATTVKAQHSLEKIWQTPYELNNPESVLLDEKSNVMYVSLVGSKESIGKIVTMDRDGKLINDNFAPDLFEAKGLGRYKDRLYVTCLKEVAVVDYKTGKTIKKIPADSAKFLNDIAVDAKGIVYVSDTRNGTIYRIENDKASLYLDNVKSANGLKCIGKDLYVLSGTSLLKISSEKNIQVIATLPCDGDGLEPVGNGDFIATCWIGYIFYVHADGKVETLLDTHEQKINTADIAFDSKKSIVYVPTFFAKGVMAFKLK